MKHSTLQTPRYIFFILGFALCFSLFFSLFQLNTSPPCINADEAAFGYNAYSLLKTGADEYGNTLPVRLKSFGDYKMPLYSYLSVPFIGMFGLNEIGVRMLNIVLAVLLPFGVFFLARELFKKDEIAAISALLVSVSLGLGLVHRHAHEAYLAVFLITLTTLFFIRFLKHERLSDSVLFVFMLFLSLFAYQSSRIYALFFFLFAIGYFIYRKKIARSGIIFLTLFIFASGLFAITDFLYKPERVESLFLFNDKGFSLKINELNAEGGSRFAYNKLTVGIRDVISQEMQYFSPEFLAINGDKNFRFGFPSMSPMTPVEYLFIFIGLYYIFKNKERWRFFLSAVLVIAPITGALSWNEGSITRSLFLFIPLLMVSAYGMYNILSLVKQKRTFPIVLGILLFAEIMFLFYSWNFYLNHYPKRAAVVRSWQCGYKELASYVKSNYDSTNTFYITRKNGEPYIFLLYFLNVPPADYQRHADLSAPDEYGFGQVEKFNKFQFSVPANASKEKNVIIVGYPDDFDQFTDIDTRKIQKIKVGIEEIFWIYKT